ncbi:MAG TPA: tetratricopeptide repeat protein [Gammaproteobacteria bacterium]|nr:tetratricopeptide repeat protein [Gammaproteobacteria bacterium]
MLALLLVSAIMYFEQALQAKGNEIQPISIILNNDENIDDAIKKTDIQTDDNSDQISELINKLIASKDVFSTIANNQSISHLTQQEKISLYLRLANTLYRTHKHIAVINVLSQVPLETRLKKEVQLMYALSLTKTAAYELAITQYQLLAKQKPNLQAANFNQAILLKKLRRCTEAIPLFEHTISISSGETKAKAFSGLAKCYLKVKQFEQSVKYFKKSIEYRPDSAITWSFLANAYASFDEFNNALSAYNKSIALQRQNYKLFVYKARFQLIHYDFTGAISTLKIAKSLSNNLEIIELLAWAYIEEGDRSPAIKQLSYLIKHSPSKKQKQRASLLRSYAEKHYDKLLSELSAKKKPRNDMLYLKSLGHRKSGQFKSAFKVLKQLTKNRDYRWRSLIQQARMTRSRQQYSDAIEKYDRLLEHNSLATSLWFETALSHEKQGQHEQGLIKINRAIALEPKNNTYMLAKARLLKLSGDIKGAINLVETLVSHKANYIRGLRLLSDFLSETEDITRLIEVYQVILTLEPDDYTTMYSLGRSLVKTGEHEASQTILKKALEVKPDYIDARLLLVQSLYLSNQFSASLDVIDSLLKLGHTDTKLLTLKNTIISKINKD